LYLAASTSFSYPKSIIIYPENWLATLASGKLFRQRLSTAPSPTKLLYF
jgi:hypothetical protein